MTAKEKQQKGDTAAKWYVMAQLAQAVHEYTEAEARLEIARKVRDDTIRRAKAMGLSLVEIATFAGVSRARVQQLAPESDLAEVDLEELEGAAATSAVSG